MPGSSIFAIFRRLMTMQQDYKSNMDRHVKAMRNRVAAKMEVTPSQLSRLQYMLIPAVQWQLNTNLCNWPTASAHDDPRHEWFRELLLRY